MFLTVRLTHSMMIDAGYGRTSSDSRRQRENSVEADFRTRWAGKQTPGAPPPPPGPPHRPLITEPATRIRVQHKQNSGAHVAEPATRTRALSVGFFQPTHSRKNAHAHVELGPALKRFAAKLFDVTAQQNTESAQASGTRSHGLAGRRAEAQPKANLGHTTGVRSCRMAGRGDAPELETPRTGYVRHLCAQ